MERDMVLNVESREIATSGRGVLRRVALLALLAGAAGSVALTLTAGHRNPSWVLRAIFAVWVLAPFAVLAAAYLRSDRWSIVTRQTLFVATALVSVGSLAAYGAIVWGPPRTQVGPVFVVVPPASGVLSLIAVLMASVMAKRKARKSKLP